MDAIDTRKPGDKGYKFVWIDRAQLARVTKEHLPEGAEVGWATVLRLAERLAHHANGGGTSIHPGNPRLAYELNTTERTIQRGLAILRDVGMVEKVREGQSRPFPRAAEYRLTDSTWLAERQPEPYKGDALDVAPADDDKGDALNVAPVDDKGDAGLSQGRRYGPNGVTETTDGVTEEPSRGDALNVAPPTIYTNHFTPTIPHQASPSATGSVWSNPLDIDDVWMSNPEHADEMANLWKPEPLVVG